MSIAAEPHTQAPPQRKSSGWRRLFAQSLIWHRRAAMIATLPLLVTIVTGLLLMVRGDFDWIQPKAVTGAHPMTTPAVGHEQVLQKLRELPPAGVKDWKDVSSVIFSPGKGIYQIRLKSNYEVQLDASDARLLKIQYRTSSLLTELHQGSFFHPLAMKWIFLPSGLLLLLLWLSGVYMYVFPKLRRRKAHREAA